MEITSAMMCEYAQVRQGQLFILGGNINTIRRKSWPARLAAHLAFIVSVHPTEFGESYEVRFVVLDEDGGELARVQDELTVPSSEQARSAEALSYPAILDLTTLKIPAPGRYSTEVMIGGHHQRTLPFRALDA